MMSEEKPREPIKPTTLMECRSRRGRKANVSPSQAIEVLKKYMQHFTSNSLPPWSSSVWHDISVDLERKWTPACVYTSVRQNRNSILDRARDELGIVVPATDRQSSEDQQVDSSEDASEDTSDDNEKSSLFVNDAADASFSLASNEEKLDDMTRFKLILSPSDWDAIKPDSSTGSGKKLMLTPRVWTNIVAIEFWKQHKLNCAFSFKRADVLITSDGLYHIKIVGNCKSAKCRNQFVGTATRDRLDNGGLVINVETRDTRNQSHEEVARHFNGKRRKDTQKELLAEGCAAWKKRNARTCMELGDLIPPFLPSDDVLRQAKKEGVDADLDVKPEDARDIIRTIEALSISQKYAGVVRAVGSLPFYTFYGTSDQMHVYNEYCRVSKGASVVSIDATGSLVSKLDLLGDRNTGHIFLYSIVINFEKTTLPVYQMLSEKHDTEFIAYWLQQWVRSGARKPREAVCDYSRALISGICMAMNHITVKSYINHCFVSVRDGRRRNENLATLIRIDVAHLIHLVCRWKCLRSVRQTKIKDFFVRCVALMIDCQTLIEFSEILTLTCSVGLQEYDDTKIGLTRAQTTREARKKLEDRIAVHGLSVELSESRYRSDSKSQDDPEELMSTGTPIEVWVQAQEAQASKIIHIGSELNPFYLPDFIRQLLRIAKEFPLWTAVTMPYEARHASSSYVEGYFNDLKTRVLKNHPMPMRVDKFLKKHATDMIGGTLLFGAKLVGFEQKGCSMPILPSKNGFEASDSRVDDSSIIPYDVAANDSDLSRENWRAKAPHQQFDDENGLDETETHERCTDNEASSSGSPQVAHHVAINEQMEWSNDDIKTLCMLDHSYCKDGNEDAENSGTECGTTTSAIVSDSCRTEEIASAESPEKLPRNATKSKYFRAFPEVRQINMLTSKSKKPSLLPNGTLCHRPVRIGQDVYFIKFTCAFDSLASILMTGAIDDDNYVASLEESENATMQFVLSLMNNGVTAALLRDRCRILKSFCPSSATTETSRRVISHTVNAWDSIGNVVNKIMETAPSVHEVETCSVCPGRRTAVPLMTPDHRVIAKMGYGQLEKALDFRARIYNVRCRNNCIGRYTIEKTSGKTLFIELDVRDTSPGMPVPPSGLPCELRQLPKTIKLFAIGGDIEYRLVGVVAYRQQHFVGYCRRKSGEWEKYDDMLKDMSNVKSGQNIEPHLAVYVQQFVIQ